MLLVTVASSRPSACCRLLPAPCSLLADAVTAGSVHGPLRPLRARPLLASRPGFRSSLVQSAPAFRSSLSHLVPAWWSSSCFGRVSTPTAPLNVFSLSGAAPSSCFQFLTRELSPLPPVFFSALFARLGRRPPAFRSNSVRSVLGYPHQLLSCVAFSLRTPPVVEGLHMHSPRVSAHNLPCCFRTVVLVLAISLAHLLVPRVPLCRLVSVLLGALPAVSSFQLVWLAPDCAV